MDFSFEQDHALLKAVHRPLHLVWLDSEHFPNQYHRFKIQLLLSEGAPIRAQPIIIDFSCQLVYISIKMISDPLIPIDPKRFSFPELNPIPRLLFFQIV
jgi:hypothetical protein